MQVFSNIIVYVIATTFVCINLFFVLCVLVTTLYFFYKHVRVEVTTSLVKNGYINKLISSLHFCVYIIHTLLGDVPAVPGTPIRQIPFTKLKTIFFYFLIATPYVLLRLFLRFLIRYEKKNRNFPK